MRAYMHPCMHESIRVAVHMTCHVSMTLHYMHVHPSVCASIMYAWRIIDIAKADTLGMPTDQAPNSFSADHSMRFCCAVQHARTSFLRFESLLPNATPKAPTAHTTQEDPMVFYYPIKSSVTMTAINSSSSPYVIPRIANSPTNWHEASRHVRRSMRQIIQKSIESLGFFSRQRCRAVV